MWKVNKWKKREVRGNKEKKMRERKKIRTHESKVNGGENVKVKMRMSEKQAYCLSKFFTNTTQG